MPKKAKKEESKKASILKRTLAYIIDNLIIGIIVIYPFQNYLNKINKEIKITDIFTSNLTSDLYIIFLTIAILSLMYFSLFEYYLKQTIGKMILKIKVISIKKEFSFLQALLRNISKVIDILLIIDIIYLLLSKEKERLFGKLSYTRVIEK
ncbi:RDD family protein [Candidatus Woesearchaeota archaeon]|nr:RDD family protein [Candidatus Woesearchaeota archaeon]